MQVLVELAQEREEDIPALVYEARSSGHPRRHPRPRQQPSLSNNRPSSSAQPPASPIAAPLRELLLVIQPLVALWRELQIAGLKATGYQVRHRLALCIKTAKSVIGDSARGGVL